MGAASGIHPLQLWLTHPCCTHSAGQARRSPGPCSREIRRPRHPLPGPSLQPAPPGRSGGQVEQESCPGEKSRSPEPHSAPVGQATCSPPKRVEETLNLPIPSPSPLACLLTACARLSPLGMCSRSTQGWEKKSWKEMRWLGSRSRSRCSRFRQSRESGGRRGSCRNSGGQVTLGSSTSASPCPGMSGRYIFDRQRI